MQSLLRAFFQRAGEAVGTALIVRARSATCPACAPALRCPEAPACSPVLQCATIPPCNCFGGGQIGEDCFPSQRWLYLTVGILVGFILGAFIGRVSRAGRRAFRAFNAEGQSIVEGSQPASSPPSWSVVPIPRSESSISSPLQSITDEAHSELRRLSERRGRRST